MEKMKLSQECFLRTQRVLSEEASRRMGEGIAESLEINSTPTLLCSSVSAEGRISEASRTSAQLHTCPNPTGPEGEKTAADFTPLPFNEF